MMKVMVTTGAVVPVLDVINSCNGMRTTGNCRFCGNLTGMETAVVGGGTVHLSRGSLVRRVICLKGHLSKMYRHRVRVRIRVRVRVRVSWS